MEHKTPAKENKNKTDDVKRKVMIEPSKHEEVDEKNTEKKAVMDTIIAELKDPNRDFNNFDPGRDQEIIRKIVRCHRIAHCHKIKLEKPFSSYFIEKFHELKMTRTRPRSLTDAIKEMF